MLRSAAWGQTGDDGSQSGGGDRHPVPGRPSTLLLYLSVDEDWTRLKTLQQVQRRPSLGMQYLMAQLNREAYPFEYRDQVIQSFGLEDVIRTDQRGRP